MASLGSHGMSCPGNPPRTRLRALLRQGPSGVFPEDSGAVTVAQACGHSWRISTQCRVLLGDFTLQERGRGGRTVSRGMRGSLLARPGALGLREA